MTLVLYVIIFKEDKAESLRNCAIPRRYVTPSKNCIGFRETVGDAVEARQTIWRGVVTDDSHAVLKLTVTLEGVARRFSKAYYRDKDTDWKVLHYIGDLPLQGNDTYDEKLYTAEWFPLSSCSTV